MTTTTTTHSDRMTELKAKLAEGVQQQAALYAPRATAAQAKRQGCTCPVYVLRGACVHAEDTGL